MPTVQQAVDILTAVTGESRRHVNVVARRLIDDGVLPKSVGSRVAQTDLKGVLALLFAIALADRIREAAEVAQEFAAIPHRGVRPLLDTTRERIQEAVKAGGALKMPTQGSYGMTLAEFVVRHVLAPDSRHSASIRLSRDTSGEASAVITIKGTATEDQHLFYPEPHTSPQFFRSATLTAQAVDRLRELLASNGGGDA